MSKVSRDAIRGIADRVNERDDDPPFGIEDVHALDTVVAGEIAALAAENQRLTALVQAYRTVLKLAPLPWTHRSDYEAAVARVRELEAE